MSTKTANINLVKPLGTENYDIAVVNANSDIIDAEITDAKAGSNTRVFKAKNDTSSIDNVLNVQGGDGRYYKKSIADVTFLKADDTAKDSLKLGGDLASLYAKKTDVPILSEKTPAGTIIDFAGSSAPSGYLVCNGGEVSNATYSDLYAVLGVLWANTGGASTPSVGNFRLPPQQIGGLGLYNRGVGATNGIVGTYQVDVFKSHTHQYAMRQGGGSTTVNQSAGNQKTLNSIQISTTGSGDATETRPRSLTVLKCIKF